MGPKKKKKHGGRRSKGRAQSKDPSSLDRDYSELVSEELTALSAIFQDDCKVVSDSPPQINIWLRPYSKDTDYEDLDVSALLSVKCIPGYPFKCPKLQITLAKGLSKTNADKLLLLLHDQASSNAREGRIMIYNLVEAAQEFLSEIVPVGQFHELIPCQQEGGCSNFSQEGATFQFSSYTSRSTFVYGFIDLFGGSREPWNWGLGTEESGGMMNSSLDFHVINSSSRGKEILHVDMNAKQVVIPGPKKGALVIPAAQLETVNEHSEEECTNSDCSIPLSVESLGKGTNSHVEVSLSEEVQVVDIIDSESLQLNLSESLTNSNSSQAIERDLVLAHLLRLSCAPKGPLANALPALSSELFNLGIISGWVRDLSSKSSSHFEKMFDQVFGQHMESSKISHFWNSASDLGDQNSSSYPSSRYLNDFEELRPLGHGGFGHVVLCKNKLDGRQYAVKKIRLKDKRPPLDDRILREVATLSRLQHQHVVRYYQAWFETGDFGCYADGWGSKSTASFSFSYKDTGSVDVPVQENKVQSTILYIQMEYCPRTLRQKLESYNDFDKGLAWHFFRQIVEGLAHIHGQGIIHRDLTPNNIFFDARNDIKIGDFGLAKFLKLEQLEQDVDVAETFGVSLDGTGQVGTYFYTAPEIEQGWPKIDEKADMYSLGVVFFELWHPFSTSMERHVVLSDLKLKSELPVAWVSEFPEQASLLQCLLSSSPSNRPSAPDLLQHAFPPRMEHEMLDNFLRTMHSSEDTSVFDKVVSAIFDDETLRTKDHHDNYGRAKFVGSDVSDMQLLDVDTENRDHVFELTKEVFRKHCARHLELNPMQLSSDSPQFNGNTVKLLTQSGDMAELCYELRWPFVKWVVSMQKMSFKRYEISYVYRRAIGHSPPNRYLQGDFDIVGGVPPLIETEIISTTMEILSHFFHSKSCDIHLNHGDLLDAILSWSGIKDVHRQKVAELLSLMNSLHPQSPERKSKWVVIRRQLRQELNLDEAAVNRLQTVGLRFCGAADQVLPRLRGALPADKRTRKALDELSELYSHLRIWRIDKNMFIDALMPPTEIYYTDLFFQVYLRKENSSGSLIEGTLLAAGGRYDYLLHSMWNSKYKTIPPGAAGVSIALETVILNSPLDLRPSRNEASTSVLVCSRGGGGLLQERMELVWELWEANIKAEFVPVHDPSLTEQYEYANDHDIKCLVIITDSSMSQKDSVKVRHLEFKKEKEVEREILIKFLLEAMATQFRNIPSKV